MEKKKLMKRKTLVSFVTPCFNSGQFIGSCIKSVLAQDYPYVEHIIQDGASTDGTVEILKKYTGKVDWVSEPDKGQSDGLNKALKRCKGDIVLVLNADDELLPHAASWGVENMEKYPDMAVVYGDQYIIDAEGKIIEALKSENSFDFHKVLCVELVPPAQAAFIRRSYFEQVGFYADAEIDTCPDYEMWVRIGLKFPMVYVPGFIAKYRFYPRTIDSKKPRTADRAVAAKKLVMDRVFDDPNVNESIRSLRRRAYGGLNVWAAFVALNEEKKYSKFFLFLYKALNVDLSFRRIYEIANYLANYFICRHFFKFIIRLKRL